MIFGIIYKGSTVRYGVEKVRFIRPDVAELCLSVSICNFTKMATRASCKPATACAGKKGRPMGDRDAAEYEDYGSGRAYEEDRTLTNIRVVRFIGIILLIHSMRQTK